MDWIGLDLTFPITDPTWIFLLVLLIILFAPILLNKLRIPHIIGMILAGLAIGEHGFNILARDMGGPFNKAAYVFGTAAIASGNYDVMAAVMIGGMTPPCAIALATMLFKKKFTKEERGSKVSNFVMGASFITEGAIPFAAADPLHVIPCTLIGAGVAGFLSALFKCTLMAPHGGIFVFATVGHPLLYILAWAVGAVITAVLLGLIKKDVK